MYYRYGFGFRGASPPWPYIGRGRGGLPRCWYQGSTMTTPYAPPYYEGYPPQGSIPYAAPMAKEQELDFLKKEANAVKSHLDEIESRIKELEIKE